MQRTGNLRPPMQWYLRRARWIRSESRLLEGSTAQLVRAQKYRAKGWREGPPDELVKRVTRRMLALIGFCGV